MHLQKFATLECLVSSREGVGMALTKCHECAQQISTSAAVCPKCGAKPRRRGTAFFFVFLAAAVALVFMAQSWQMNATREVERRKQEQRREQAAEIAKQKADAFTDARDSVLTTARAAVAKGEFETAAEAIKSWSGVNDAGLDEIRLAIATNAKALKEAEEKKDLQEIAAILKPDAVDEGIRVYGRLSQLAPDNKNYATKLAHFRKIKPQVDANKKARAELASRKAFAQATEEKFLAQGMSATVTARGRNSTTLYIKFVLVSKAFAYQVQHADNFISECRRLGFTKIEMHDGYSEGWSFSLPPITRKPML